MSSSALPTPATAGEAAPAAERTSPGGRRGRRLVATLASLLGVVPFGLLVTFFLAIPTLVVVIGSFLDAVNRFTLANIEGLAEDVVVQAYVRSIWISALTAIVGAALGALLALFAGVFIAIGAGHLLPEAQTHRPGVAPALVGLAAVGAAIVMVVRSVVG